MKPLIELDDVHKSFGPHPVLRGLSLAVPPHSVYAFLGNNGAGKSTTIRLITGLLGFDAGAISVLGLDIRRQRRAILKQIGAIVDAPCFYPNLSADEFLRIACAAKAVPRSDIDRVLALTGLLAARSRLIADYSLGMKQRLAIAHALIGAPRLLILDEPTNGLDPEGIRDMRELISSLPAQTGSTVFVSSHNLDEVEKVATHVCVLARGAALYEGTIAALMERQAGVLTLDVDDAGRAAHLLAQAGYAVRADGETRLAVSALGQDETHQVNALVVGAGLRLSQAVYRRPTLEQWFLESASAEASHA